MLRKCAFWGAGSAVRANSGRPPPPDSEPLPVLHTPFVVQGMISPWLRTVGIVEHVRPCGGADGFAGRIVLGKPVVVHVALLLGLATDHHGRLRGAECVSVDLYGRARNVCAVFAIAPAVHVEAVAQGRAPLHVVSRHIRAAGTARSGNGVAIPIEQVVLDQ